MNDVEKMRRLRGTILLLLRDRHDEQQSHADSVMLWSNLNKLSLECGQNEVMTTLQDLKGRGYVNFVQDRNKFTNRVYAVRIEITPKGRDLVDELLVDPAVVV